MVKKIQSDIELEKFLCKYTEFYLYGAGNVCMQLMRIIEAMDKKNAVKDILVSNSQNNVSEIFGISVNLCDFKNINKDLPIVVAVSSYYEKEIYDLLLNNNMKFLVLLNVDTDFEVERWFKNILYRVKENKIIKYINKNSYNNTDLDIIFFTLPYWDVYAPFSAVPSLVAKLKSEGFSAGQLDLGIRSVNHLIRSKGDVAANRCLSEEFFNNKVIPYVNNQYNDYISFKKDMWFLQREFNLEEIKKRYFELNDVQKGILEAFYVQICTMDMADIDFDNCIGIDNAVNQCRSMNFLETLEEPDIIALLQKLPDIIGISVTSTGQFLISCIFAKFLKCCKPNIKIIFGGSCANIFVKSKCKNKQEIRKYFDYILIGEGETAMTLLMNKLCRNKDIPLEEIPNMASINPSGSVYFTKYFMEDVNELLPPDYDDLDLNLYFAPKTVLPYQASRGCHYGQCAFCNHDEHYRHHYRPKNVKKVVKELIELSIKYSVDAFQFVDEAIREDCFEEMISEMDRHCEFKHIKWFYYSRVDRRYNEEVLKKAKRNGCEMVMFGVETFNQRLLKFIKKGIRAETSKYCLELFHRCGIKTYSWLMCNLPSETVDEAKEDMRKVREMANDMDAFWVGVFCLYANTDMYKVPEKFNIIEMHASDASRFISHNNGVIIDKETMLDFYENEYLLMQNQFCFTWNRYTYFFG